MSKHANAEAVVAWVSRRPSASVSDVAAAGLMNLRTASDAVQYAVRCGALEHVFRRGASVKERGRYRATGVALPVRRTRGAGLSFDGLLQAWGMVLVPRQLRAVASRRYQLPDSE